MAFTPESIAAAYQQAVAAGISPETFAQVAQRDYGVTPGQLVAAQATLVGADNPVVQNNLRALPQQEVVNYLRASSPTRINVTGVENQGEGGGMVYTAPGGLAGGGNMLRPTYRAGSGEGAVDTLTGFTRPLTPEFDPTFAGGQFGNYVGVYDPQGNLVDIRFQQQERHGGFLAENLDWIGPLVVGGAAAAGGLLGGAAASGTGAGAGGLDLVGSDWAIGAATGPTGGLLPTTATGLTAANTAAASGVTGAVNAGSLGGGLDLVGSDWATGAATGPTGGLLNTTTGGLTAANTAAASGVEGAVNQGGGVFPGPSTPTPGGGTPRPPGGGGTTIPGVTGTDWAQIIGQLANVLGGANAANAAREAAQIQAGLGREALGLQREMFERQVGLQEPFRQGGLAAQNRLMDLLGLGLSPEQLANLYRERVGQGGATEADFVNWARSQGVPDSRLMQARNMLLGGPGAAGTGMSDFGSAARPFSMDAFRADPGYGFRLSEGLKALERSQAARGGLMSGGTGKALQRFGQDMASQEYGNAFNRFYTEREALLNPLLSLSGRGQTSATQTGQAAQQFGQQGAQSLTGIGNAMAAGQVGQANAINQTIGQGVSMYNQGQNQNLLNQVLARSMG